MLETKKASCPTQLANLVLQTLARRLKRYPSKRHSLRRTFQFLLVPPLIGELRAVPEAVYG